MEIETKLHDRSQNLIESNFGDSLNGCNFLGHPVLKNDIVKHSTQLDHNGFSCLGGGGWVLDLNLTGGMPTKKSFLPGFRIFDFK